MRTHIILPQERSGLKNVDASIAQRDQCDTHSGRGSMHALHIEEEGCAKIPRVTV
jgi:hypothetical protein